MMPLPCLQRDGTKPKFSADICLKRVTQDNTMDRFNGTVAVWFGMHHHGHDSRDWNNIREFGGPYHPLLGYYRSDDPEVLRTHLHWMRRAGIDMIVYDMCPCEEAKPALTDLSRDRSLHLLADELSNQRNESRKLSLCVWIEKYADDPTVEEYQCVMDYVRAHFSDKDWYYRYNGKPLIVTYLNGVNRAVGQIERDNRYFELRRVRPYYCDVWSYVEEYPQLIRTDWISVSPGHDAYMELAYQAKYLRKEPSPDFQAIRNQCRPVDREDGNAYRRQLEWAMQNNPDIIFVSGWNDWQYCLQIEPAVEYGRQYLDLTAQLTVRWDETAPYREDVCQLP